MKYFSVLYNKFIYRNLISRKLNRVGKNFKFGYSSELINPQYFSIGDNFFTGPNTYSSTNKNNLVKIGNHVMFGPDCKIIGGNHDIQFNKNHMYFNKEIDHMNSTIKIEDGVWIASSTILLSNTYLAEGSVIGAMSLVNSYIPPYSIAVGIPAKKISKRFKNSEDLKELLRNVNSKYTFDEINSIYKKCNIEY